MRKEKKMIVEPNVYDLLKVTNIGSRYTLVIAAAKRARRIAEGNPDMDKAVSTAINEIAEGKITIIHPAENDDYNVYAEYSYTDKEE